MLENIVESIKEENISVIASKPLQGRIHVLLYLLEELGIKQKKRIKVISFDGSSIWYTSKMVSYLSGISYDLVHKAYYPCLEASKTKEKIDPLRFMAAVNKLQKSFIYMSDCDFLLDEKIDWCDEIVDSTIDTESYDYLLINTFDCLEKRSKYTGKEIMKKLSSYAKRTFTKIILICDVKFVEKERLTAKMIEAYPVLQEFGDYFLCLKRERFLNKKQVKFCYIEEKGKEKRKGYFLGDAFTSRLKEGAEENEE